MPARAIWKAVVRFDDVELPVKLYSAVEDHSIRFHLLHDQDMVRVQQRLMDAANGKPVASDAVRKGYEVERDLFVVLENDEIEQLQPKPSREIAVTRFVERAAIPHQYYARPYYLGPDGGESDYFAFAEALGKQEQAGIARWVLRGKRYAGALQALDGYLLLMTLLFTEEVIATNELTPPKGRELDRKERALAGQLVAALEEDFNLGEFRDEYRDRVMELIEAKRKGKTVEVKTRPRKPAGKSLVESLQASLKSVG